MFIHVVMEGDQSVAKVKLANLPDKLKSVELFTRLN